MIDNRNYTGKSIKARRNQLKMSQETLAEKANTTQSTISKIERGIQGTQTGNPLCSKMGR